MRLEGGEERRGAGREGEGGGRERYRITIVTRIGA